MEWLKLIHGTTQPTRPAAIRPGDEVRVWFKILEQGKERLGQFEGLVIRAHGHGSSKTFTVRRVTHGEGVERVFPFDAKTVARIEVLRQGHVKRSRLYFLRTVVGKTRIAAADPSHSSTSATAVTPSATEKGTARKGSEETRRLPERSAASVVTADQPAPRAVSGSS
jgi:large subunit ribosomal protein L19